MEGVLQLHCEKGKWQWLWKVNSDSKLSDKYIWYKNYRNEKQVSKKHLVGLGMFKEKK